jgi:hypothetical protein
LAFCFPFFSSEFFEQTKIRNLRQFSVIHNDALGFRTEIFSFEKKNYLSLYILKNFFDPGKSFLISQEENKTSYYIIFLFVFLVKVNNVIPHKNKTWLGRFQDWGRRKS